MIMTEPHFVCNTRLASAFIHSFTRKCGSPSRLLRRLLWQTPASPVLIQSMLASAAGQNPPKYTKASRHVLDTLGSHQSGRQRHTYPDTHRLKPTKTPVLRATAKSPAGIFRDASVCFCTKIAA
jgi:hypothetical protein